MPRTLPLYQVDAFTREPFSGNPAAVCPLDDWLGDEVMQKIAAENNLSETAFFVPDENGEADYRLRWFTPTREVELCGHATLASAWVLFNELGVEQETIVFVTQKAGLLSVRRGEGGVLVMDFPANPPRPTPHHEKLGFALGGDNLKSPAKEFYSAPNTMRLAVLGSARDVIDLKPQFWAVAEAAPDGLIVTAQGEEGSGVDFVSRYFAPAWGINEDPVTGSAHTVLAPYWAKRLKKDSLRARQVSKRGGDVFCEMVGDRVRISGHAVLYLKGEARI